MNRHARRAAASKAASTSRNLRSVDRVIARYDREIADLEARLAAIPSWNYWGRRYAEMRLDVLRARRVPLAETAEAYRNGLARLAPGGASS